MPPERGVEDVVESLYRGSDRRPAALPRFEPALRPPADAEGYAWLYRPEPQPAPTGTAAAGADTVVCPPAPSAGVPRTRRRGVRALVAGSGLLLGAALSLPLLAYLF